MTKASPVPGLIADLAAEHGDLASFLDTLPADAWRVETPAAGWTIHDQVAHLAHFDEVTAMAIGRPEQFREFRDGLEDLQTYVDGVGARFAHLTPRVMVDWWKLAGESLLRVAGAVDPGGRVPWFGPDMSLASKLTARIMEVWAHGQDVYDTVGVRRVPTPRLAHLVRIGVLAMPNSFRIRGLAVPDTPVLVDLEGVDGARCTMGVEGARDVVRGTMEDFALVVTQRRHIDDVGLQVEGPVARHWMEIAQAFAGPVGPGRAPGQFARSGAVAASMAPRRHLRSVDGPEWAPWDSNPQPTD